MKTLMNHFFLLVIICVFNGAFSMFSTPKYMELFIHMNCIDFRSVLGRGKGEDILLKYTQPGRD
jgi:hypothetical protein